MPGGGTGVSCLCGMVHLEIAGECAVDRLGNPGVAGGELFRQERCFEVDWMARRQLVASDGASNEVLWIEFRRDICGGGISGDAAAHACTCAGAAAIRELPGVLPAATGGTEFAGDESPAARVSREGGIGGIGRRTTVRSASLAKSGAGAGDVCGWNGDGLVVRKRTKYCAAGDRTSGAGVADLVGVSVGLASFDAGGAGVLDVRGEVKGKTRCKSAKV